jgi:hypothetical protein
MVWWMVPVEADMKFKFRGHYRKADIVSGAEPAYQAVLDNLYLSTVRQHWKRLKRGWGSKMLDMFRVISRIANAKDRQTIR